MGIVYSTDNSGQVTKKDIEVVAKEREYIMYILEHINNVISVYETLFEGGKPYIPAGFTNDQYIEAMKQVKAVIKDHDQSKYSPEEFDAYRVKFYPTAEEQAKMDESAEYYDEVMSNFNKAWEHHYTVNDHHTKYWWKDGQPQDMPLYAIIHMICDWCAMSLKFQGKMNAVTDWYTKDADKEKSEMTENTRKIVEEMLFLIFGKL